MRIVTYSTPDGWRPGVVSGDSVVPLDAALRAAGVAGDPVTSVRDFLERHGDSLVAVSEAVAAAGTGDVPAVGRLDDLRLGPPVQDPAKVLCVGLNYSDHVGETGRALPTHPDLFAKFASSLVGDRAELGSLEVTDNLDFEGELAIVIGRPAHRVAEAEALSFVAGLSVLNDITARDLQYRGTQWLAGKALDASTPFGPALVTLDEIGDPQTLDIRTTVNGVEVQSSNTEHMIFPVAHIVSYISQFLTLSPGDVIATGTPQGIGAKRQPPLWLKSGDTVTVELERVGTLSNTVA